ncbi:MAG TPA: hypothetical protein P5511_07350, partial [Candidatus Goldiibacteriota bacterium]|nr:hypothetical protein [Candidatus Goldiibacteriota bacterium]
VSYSIDTIRHFETEFPGTKFYFIIGSDAFYFIDTWKEYQKVLSIIDFIIYERRGYPREKISAKFPGKSGIYWIENRYISISSSDIRKKPPSAALEEDVGAKIAGYIRQNRLYEGHENEAS